MHALTLSSLHPFIFRVKPRRIISFMLCEFFLASTMQNSNEKSVHYSSVVHSISRWNTLVSGWNHFLDTEISC